MKYKYINYIVGEFQKEYPTKSVEEFEKVLLRHSEDELYRLANAIERFGIESVVNLVENSI